MFIKKTTLKIVLWTVVATLISVNVASGFFEEETLYPIENVTRTKVARTLPAAEQQSANPFIPLLSDLPEIPSVEQPYISEAQFSQRFDARNLEVKLLASKPTIELEKVEHCKALLEKTLSALPAELTASLDSMKLFFSKRNPRGLSNSHIVELRCGSLDDAEIVSVFVHELGHIVDLGKLKGASIAPSGFMDGELKIPADDPSIQFYQFSWKNEKEQRFLAERKDFVSGYAMSDPFEDFAESFNFYVLHGADFRTLMTESPILTKKYEFLKNEVFDGIEFDSEVTAKSGKRVWDTTLVNIDLEEFFTRA